MKRRYWVLALLLLVLAACGSSGNPASTSLWDSGKWEQATWQ